MSKFWTKELEAFKLAKRKSAQMTDLLSLAERLVAKVEALKGEVAALKTTHQNELTELNKEIKDMRHELEIAWKNQE